MVFLTELLRSLDFGAAVGMLAREFREKHALPDIHQLGLVVPDVEAAASELESRGIGPFFIAVGSPVLWNERGDERTFRGKVGLAYYQGLEIELLEPGKGSNFYKQSIDPKGRIVVQHLGFLVDDVDEWSDRLAGKGNPLWVRGKIKSGPLSLDFTYMDTIAEAGIIIEFISSKIIGLPLSPPPRLIHFLGRIQKLSGKRCFSM